MQTGLKLRVESPDNSSNSCNMRVRCQIMSSNMFGVRLFQSNAIVLLITFAVGAGADVPAGQVAEVEHLIEYLQNSDCRMVRNGKPHSSKDGANHVRRKYAHFRNEISSTEDFIRYSATKSTISGRYYEVLCPGEAPVRSKDWLLEELRAYRSR